MAERLWSARDMTDPLLAAQRLARHLCRLVQRLGVAAGPIWSDFCLSGRGVICVISHEREKAAVRGVVRGAKRSRGERVK